MSKGARLETIWTAHRVPNSAIELRQELNRLEKTGAEIFAVVPAIIPGRPESPEFIVVCRRKDLAF